MTWSDAETAIRSLIETQWALSSYADVPLVFENENIDAASPPPRFVFVSIDGTYSDKTIYGSVGKRVSSEGGIVFFHAFVPQGEGKSAATGAVVAMTSILELQQLSGGINLEGGDPPSPADPGDINMPNGLSAGNFYRCSGAVPFTVIGSR